MYKQFKYIETDQTHRIIILDWRAKNYNKAQVNMINMMKDENWDPISFKYIAS